VKKKVELHSEVVNASQTCIDEQLHPSSLRMAQKAKGDATGASV
jgi:hypothetical protein